MSALPVFYDSQQNRFRRSRLVLACVTALIAVAFAVFVGSLVIRPQLPALSVAAPSSGNRPAADVVVHKALGDEPPINFDIAAFIAQNKIKPLPSERRETKMYGFYVNWDENSMTSLREHIDSIDVLIPEWLHLADGTGALSVDDADRMEKTLQLIQEKKPELPIVPLVNNYNNETQGWDSAMLKQVMDSPESRRELIGNLLGFVNDHRFSGISIDFEDVPKKDHANLLLFMQELAAEFHKTGLTVSQSIPLEDDLFDAKALGQSADQLILMAYDEHTTGSSLAGPVASQGWFSKAVAKRFRQLPPEKYIVAMGGYGYDWEGDTTKGSETTFASALRIASDAKARVLLNAQSLNPTYSYYDADNVLHSAWFLDAVSSFNQMQAVRYLGTPNGYALWRLGSEDPSLWNIMPKKDALDASAAASLKKIPSGYDVGYQGDGEILRVSGMPQDGLRNLTYDPASGFITRESIAKFPSPYMITRYGGTEDKHVVLTFDDGPDETYTPQILDILKRYRVPATFFVMGMNASAHPDILQRIVDEGSEIGNHTYTHPDVTAVSKEQFRVEIDATERLLEGIVGRKSLLFRPPYAEDIEPTTPEQVAPLAVSSDLGYYTAGINIDPTDWKRPGVDAIVRTVVDERKAGVGNIVLMHDSGGDRSQTVEALPRIIEELQADGYVFVSVSDVLGLSRDDVMPPLGARERWLARVNGVALFSLFGFMQFLSFIFVLGIVLGVARFLFIAVLALRQAFLSRKRKIALAKSEFAPRIAVIVPAYNEANVIAKTIASLLESSYPDFRIIVVDDGSTDATAEIVRKTYGENPRVVLFSRENQGKSGALNFGIAQTASDEEYIVTLDADTVFRSDTIGMLVRCFADPEVAAVAGNAKVGNRVNILTKWQALEYITSQNLDRRAFEVMNCISVVPGSVGAWRKSAVLEAGGFSSDTLAEDADLTFAILRSGHRVAFEDDALAFTEAPDTVRGFVKQRFRWMFGTMQTAWKHKQILFRKRYGALGFFAIPNIFVFQVFFTLVSPFMDLMLVGSVSWALWQKHQHPASYDMLQALNGTLSYYLFFLAVDMLTSLLPFLIERREQWRLLLYLPLQRFFYRQLMYYVAIKSTAAAIKGTFVRWGNIERKATARIHHAGR